jgi:hypothetical protein
VIVKTAAPFQDADQRDELVWRFFAKAAGCLPTYMSRDAGPTMTIRCTATQWMIRTPRRRTMTLHSEVPGCACTSMHQRIFASALPCIR